MKLETRDNIMDITMMVVAVMVVATVVFMYLLFVDMIEMQQTGACDMCMVLPWLVGS